MWCFVDSGTLSPLSSTFAIRWCIRMKTSVTSCSMTVTTFIIKPYWLEAPKKILQPLSLSSGQAHTPFLGSLTSTLHESSTWRQRPQYSDGGIRKLSDQVTEFYVKLRPGTLVHRWSLWDLTDDSLHLIFASAVISASPSSQPHSLSTIHITSEMCF